MSSQMVIFRTAVLVMLSMLVISCQTKEPPPVTDAEILQLSKQIHPRAIEQMVSLNGCMSLGGEIGDEANSLYLDWLKANSKPINASELYLAHTRQDWVQWQGGTFSLQDIKQYRDVVVRVQKQQNLANRGPDARYDICQASFEQANAFYDSYAEPRKLSALYEQVSSINAGALGAFELFKLLPKLPTPGKSFYQVTQSLAQTCPRAVELLTLNNSWPQETYASYCQNSGLALIECDWGKCSKQEPTDIQD
ncbi:hypothetical protein KO507_15415 [Gilvimarinus agarilyticus]|uniref:hypothetical protein n=1 Tax=Gilvimarinus sp. 2_MG-2023 TaxID=3062666 RepID=UPI001C096FB8|nr:hypothetical protein [Gilvimarinus sp. 2_MG-2023]MBU2887154.1 hypothetical protein [Gilvimarinus agarilyticus]MDO6571813.1 hypothetical protein [Gilvimarinus sp. 2_MG-2023]